ncbi:MAG TPA: endonuclease/exonuclease/phosphatase family protein [Polyangia bacterium]|nr:endonuclease/exonuclease/phosphatase family protein [Polyangia bacterium]
MSRPPSRLRVASYNIHQCVGTDRRRDPARVAAVLREIDADVIGLQEVDARPGAATDSMQMQYLASALGLHAVAGPTIVRHDGHYGNALLSRRPVLDVRRVELTVYRREPRAAIDADVDVDGTAVRVIVTHLGLLPGERRIQVQRLLDVLAGHDGGTTVLCGDINEWFAVGRPLRWLNARLGRAAAVRTFPTPWPVFALDRLWVSPRAAAATVRAHVTPTSRVASDHLPLVADIVLP